jgi:hypothetical protein
MRNLDRALEHEIGRAPVRARHRHLGAGAPCPWIGPCDDRLDEAELTGIPQRDAVRGVESDPKLMPESGRESRRDIKGWAAHSPFDGAHVFLPDLRQRPNLSLREACREARGAYLPADSLPELTGALTTDIGGAGAERTHATNRPP